MLIRPHMRLTYRGQRSTVRIHHYHVLDQLAQLALILRQSGQYGYVGQ